MSCFAVEKAALSDAQDICALEEKYIRCAWSKLQISDALGDERYSFFVVRDGGKAIAYGGVRFVLDEAEICNIVTDERFRRRGIAEKILDSIIDECDRRGAEKIFLEVESGNESAKNLYKKKGFEKISERKNYYGENLTAEIMENVKNGDFRKRN